MDTPDVDQPSKTFIRSWPPFSISFRLRFSRSLSSTELYSYTEEPEFALNRDCFEEDFRSHGTVLSVCEASPQMCHRSVSGCGTKHTEMAPLLFITETLAAPPAADCQNRLFLCAAQLTLA